MTRLSRWLVLFLLLAACENQPAAVASPRPSPKPHTAPTAAILQSGDVPATINACPGSGPLDVYIAVMESSNSQLASQLSAQWNDLLSHGASRGAISVYASDPAACKTELGATTTVKAVTSIVIQFEDAGQADRAWQSGVFGFIPPSSGELLPGLVRGAGTGLGLSSFTYERPSVRLAVWRQSVYVALVAVSNFDSTTFQAATAAIDPRLN